MYLNIIPISHYSLPISVRLSLSLPSIYHLLTSLLPPSSPHPNPVPNPSNHCVIPVVLVCVFICPFPSLPFSSFYGSVPPLSLSSCCCLFSLLLNFVYCLSLSFILFYFFFAFFLSISLDLFPSLIERGWEKYSPLPTSPPPPPIAPPPFSI